jgi:unspecific monooxygenase
VVNRAFLSRQVERMAPAIKAKAHRCIDRFQAQGQTELLANYATPIPVSVITELLGVPESSGEQLIAWSHAMVRVYTRMQGYDEEVQANAAARDFSDFLHRLLDDRRKQPADDLLSHLLSIRIHPRPLHDDEIVSVAILLLNAGHEATVHQLGNAVHLLLNEYPEHKRRVLIGLLTDDEQSNALVNECLRLDAPLHLFTRYAQESVTLAHGPTLQPGDQVGLLLAAANRCPTRFEQPDVFNPQRHDAAHLSLGAGIHFCVGAHLARLELRIALQVLFQRLPALVLNGHVEYQDAYHFHGLRRLPVRW